MIDVPHAPTGKDLKTAVMLAEIGWDTVLSDVKGCLPEKSALHDPGIARAQSL
ncbi:hypothetical protein ACFO5X_20025 [Seohaeicola nanhaiensis]|uniref:Uncharacterized protein n=1 Tax=Seohaeicola nanhaiensis TaxID=1387282 RepID=A0ABV9KMM3_9RHOB